MGILKLKNWARVATIAASHMGVIFDFWTSLMVKVAEGWFPPSYRKWYSPYEITIYTLLFISVHAFIIWYLTRPHVRQAFEHKANASVKAQAERLRSFQV